MVRRIPAGVIGKLFRAVHQSNLIIHFSLSSTHLVTQRHNMMKSARASAGDTKYLEALRRLRRVLATLRPRVLKFYVELKITICIQWTMHV